MVNTLLQHSHPTVSPSNFLPLPLSFPSLVRSVDYEDTSSSLTVWPLRHVLMRSASLHCIINKSEKWLFLCLFPHTVLYLPLFLCLLSGGVGWRRWGVGGGASCRGGGTEPCWISCVLSLVRRFDFISAIISLPKSTSLLSQKEDIIFLP